MLALEIRFTPKVKSGPSGEHNAEIPYGRDFPVISSGTRIR